MRRKGAVASWGAPLGTEMVVCILQWKGNTQVALLSLHISWKENKRVALL